MLGFYKVLSETIGCVYVCVSVSVVSLSWRMQEQLGQNLTPRLLGNLMFNQSSYIGGERGEGIYWVSICMVL